MFSCYQLHEQQPHNYYCFQYRVISQIYIFVPTTCILIIFLHSWMFNFNCSKCLYLHREHRLKKSLFFVFCTQLLLWFQGERGKGEGERKERNRKGRKGETEPKCGQRWRYSNCNRKRHRIRTLWWMLGPVLLLHLFYTTGTCSISCPVRKLTPSLIFESYITF